MADLRTRRFIRILRNITKYWKEVYITIVMPFGMFGENTYYSGIK